MILFRLSCHASRQRTLPRRHRHAPQHALGAATAPGVRERAQGRSGYRQSLNCCGSAPTPASPPTSFIGCLRAVVSRPDARDMRPAGRRRWSDTPVTPRASARDVEHDVKAASAVPAQQPPHVCPGCGSGDIERVRRRSVLDRLVRVFCGWRVYRCFDCRRRFYDRPSSRSRPAAGG